MKRRTFWQIAARALIAAGCVVGLGATACGALLGFDGKTGATDDAGPSTVTVSGAFVSGGASVSGATKIRGQFSWAPAHPTTSGPVTVSGGFH